MKFKKNTLWFGVDVILTKAAIPVKPSNYVKGLLLRWRKKNRYSRNIYPEKYPIVYPRIMPIHMTETWKARWMYEMKGFCHNSTLIADQFPKITGFWMNYMCRQKKECEHLLTRQTYDNVATNKCTHRWHYVMGRKGGKWGPKALYIPSACSSRDGLAPVVPVLYSRADGRQC